MAEARKKLQPGDKVVMNDRYKVSNKYHGQVFIVSSEPWMCGGSEIIRLHAYSGGYSTDGLDLVEEASHVEE